MDKIDSISNDVLRIKKAREYSMLDREVYAMTIASYLYMAADYNIPLFHNHPSLSLLGFTSLVALEGLFNIKAIRKSRLHIEDVCKRLVPIEEADNFYDSLIDSKIETRVLPIHTYDESSPLEKFDLVSTSYIFEDNKDGYQEMRENTIYSDMGYVKDAYYNLVNEDLTKCLKLTSRKAKK